MRISATPEASAEIRGVNLHLLWRKSSGLCCVRTIDSLELRSCPHFAGIGAKVDNAVDGFHHGVRKERNLVNRLNLFCGRAESSIGVAIFANALARGCGLSAIVFEHLRGAEGLHNSEVPLDFECVTCGLCVPESVGDYGDSGW